VSKRTKTMIFIILNSYTFSLYNKQEHIQKCPCITVIKTYNIQSFDNNNSNRI